MRRKKKSVALLMQLMLLSWIVLGCDVSAQSNVDFFTETSSIDLSEETVNQVALGDSEVKVEVAFGQPEKIVEADNAQSKQYIYDGIVVTINEGYVRRYVIDDTYPTGQGVRMGDHKTSVINNYGEHYYERIETGAEIVGYFDKRNQINVEFAFNADQLIGVTTSQYDR